MTPAREKELVRHVGTLTEEKEVTGFLWGVRQQNECTGEVMAALKRKCEQEGWAMPASK